MNIGFKFLKKNNFSVDLKEFENCLKATKNIDFVYIMACNMGGMSFIENNKSACMVSVLINTNLLRSCDNTKIKTDIGWSPSISLKEGLLETYNWIYNQLKSNNNGSKFTKS